MHLVATTFLSLTLLACSRATPPLDPTSAAASPASSVPVVSTPAGSTPAGSTPAAASTSNPPCVAGPPLEARAIYKQFERQAWAPMMGPDETVPPAESFGTCTVDRGVIRDASGHTIAELGCGVRILARGIRDELGLEIGATGGDVVTRTPTPRTKLMCRRNGPDQTWCRYERPDDGDTDGTAYIVDGTFAGDVMLGAAAERWFTSRPIVEIMYSVWCH